MGMPVPADGAAPGYFGVYPALVTDLVDPDGLGRVQVRFPWLGTDGDRDVRAWATLCSPYADDDQGLQILPEVGSQVVVAFEAGNIRRPYVARRRLERQGKLPQSPDSANNIRVLRTRGRAGSSSTTPPAPRRSRIRPTADTGSCWTTAPPSSPSSTRAAR